MVVGDGAAAGDRDVNGKGKLRRLTGWVSKRFSNISRHACFVHCVTSSTVYFRRCRPLSSVSCVRSFFSIFLLLDYLVAVTIFRYIQDFGRQTLLLYI